MDTRKEIWGRRGIDKYQMNVLKEKAKEEV